MENERRPDKRWLWWRGAIVGSFLLFLFASPWPWDFPTPFERFHLSVFLVWLLGWPPVTWKRLGLCLLGAIPLAALGIVRLFLWDGLVGSQIRVFPIQEILLCLPWSWSFMVVLGALGSLLFRGMRRVTAGRHRAIYVFATLFLMIYLGTVYFVLIASLLRFKIPVRGACPFPHEDVTFPASDGRILKGWFVPSKDPNPVGYAMVFHCASGNRSQTGRFSRYLYERGFSLLLFDHRGHGESQGHLSTLGPLETRDVAGAIEFLKTKGPIPAGSILCAGESMGAIMSLIAGGLYPEFGPVLAHASYCDLPSAGKDLVGKFLGPFTQPVVGLTWRLAQWIMEPITGETVPYARSARSLQIPCFSATAPWIS